MSDILQYKALSNKIKEALNEKVIGDVHVEYSFDPSAFGMVIIIAIDDPLIVAIDDPSKKQISYYYRNPRWFYHIALDDFIIKDLFDDEEETSKLISQIVSNILDKYKEHVYKRYFFS